MVKPTEVPMRNPDVILRKESDEWSILFNPNSGDIYGLDPISTFVWKNVDGKNSLECIVSKLKKRCINPVPNDALQDIENFVKDLASKRLVNLLQ